MDPVITTTCGRVRGTTEDGIGVFRGIPYAAAPVGPLRFRPPASPQPWSGVRDADTFGPVAPQHDLPGVIGELLAPVVRRPQGDDCLNLNVWTPEPGGAGLPVLVWIHGGSFSGGSGADPIYDGATFARDGIVCVTVNYRLGAAGFLSVGEEGAGNYGMLDQEAGLRWVHDNIGAFGGDPSNVTIAGESAGAMSVGALLGAPSARGLFRRAIAQSGACHTGLSLESAERIARHFCARAGVGRQQLDELQALTSEQIVAIQQDLANEVLTTRDVERFGPEVVSSTMAFQPVIGADFLPWRPIDAVADGAASGVDVLVGHTRDELQIVFGLDPGLWGAADDAVVDAFFESAFPGRGAAVMEVYRAGCPGGAALELLMALETDRMFRLPAVRLAEAQARHGTNAYFYRLSWCSPAFEGRLKACHALDLPFVWDNLDDAVFRRLTGPDAPEMLADAMHRSWTAFVATGDPGHSKLPEWPTYDLADRAVMDFDEEPRVVSDPGSAQRTAWEGVL